jgi:hypothetical protein
LPSLLLLLLVTLHVELLGEEGILWLAVGIGRMSSRDVSWVKNDNAV